MSSPVPSPTKAPTSTTSDPSSGPSIDPLPAFASLDLSLSRDQGTLHAAGYGAGSEAHTISPVADRHHSIVAERILSKSSAHAALGPENLPMAPTELPTLPKLTEGALVQQEGLLSPQPLHPNGLLTPVSSAQSSVAGTSSPATVNNPGVSSTQATPGVSRVGTPAPPTTTASSTPMLAGRAIAPSTSTKDGSKKSVFGKLFDRNNASSASLSASERMERGDSGGTNGSNAVQNGSASTNGTSANGGSDGAALARKPSKKETDKAEKERRDLHKAEEKAAEKERKEAEKLLRVPSGNGKSSMLDKDGRPRAGSNAGESSGMGEALNNFMRNKVQRKSSVTSKKSDDGKSDRGSEAGDSKYGGSTNGDGKSKDGRTTASLLKKYGVCEKVAIGKGATATVKLAHKWDRTTERLYAVKEFRKRRKNETEKEYVKKLTSEFCISSTLHHHNIVETVDLVQDEQSHWCEVMEYCPGGDLYAAIKKGSMTAPAINSYFKQILSGVSYLHSMGVAHRDIKPENLLLDAKGHVKITDFGVSDVFRMCWEKTTHLSKGLCGSEPYIAPEQFEQKEYDARQVDVWACAVVFYCMHFQELPWRVAKPSDPSFGPYLQMYAASQSAPAPLSNLVPRECRQIIKRMLDPDPKTRATTEQIANDPWFKAILVIPALEGIHATPPVSSTPVHIGP
ncbi:hypothetical protein RQP46_003776 [Phenoliferia psychrophenolica]